MDEPPDEAPPTLSTETELNELLGLFDAPAFVRRGQDLEYALTRIDARCRRERDDMFEMLRVRLRQWAAVSTGPETWSDTFAGPVDHLWTLSAAEPPLWASGPAPLRRRRAVARDLIASIVRFNRRWTHFLGELNLDSVNRLIDNYNRYYVLEKECCLGSTRLAMRHFTPKVRLTRDGLLEQYPTLPVPALID